jgi:hypothetical protein
LRQGRYVTVKIFAAVTAIAGAAALTLATMIALVRGTILAVSIDSLPLRVLAVSADLILGTLLLVGCIYLATHLAVRILGVGNAEFPPLPIDTPSKDAPRVSGSVSE